MKSQWETFTLRRLRPSWRSFRTPQRKSLATTFTHQIHSQCRERGGNLEQQMQETIESESVTRSHIGGSSASRFN